MALPNMPIDVNAITNVSALLKVLKNPDKLEVDFVPSFLQRLGLAVPVKNTKFTLNDKLGRYELEYDLETKVDEGGDRDLTFRMAVHIKPDKGSDGRPADYLGTVTLPVPGSAALAFKGVVNRDAEDMFVGECTFTAKSMSLAGLLEAIVPSLAGKIPQEIAVPAQASLAIVLAERESDASARRLIFGVGLHAGVDLSRVPVVGELFTKGISKAAFTLELLAATHAFTHEELKKINGVTSQLDSAFVIRPSSAEQQGLDAGGHLVGYAVFDDLKRAWYAPLRKTAAAKALLAVGRSLERKSGGDGLVTVSDNGAWIAVQRSVGALRLAKLGITYRKGAVEFVPEMTITLGGLSLILDGIVVRLPVAGSEGVSFRLDGLGIEFKNECLHVGGAFLHTRGEHDDYAGQAALQFKSQGGTIGIAAIGAYAQVDGRPSFFIYASLDYPLGGPPFFFVTGISAGFGFGRELTSPALEKIKSFPLVRQAIDGTPSPITGDPRGIVTSQLRALGDYIKIVPDAGFIAAGVKFTSCKMIEGFALLTAAIGKKFELGLLGLARVQVPFSGPKPLAVMELALQARIAPTEGLLLVRAQLTPESYILSKDVRLMGGFALATWFAGPHAGDFVLTLGGYHPSFDRPDHYPIVPRLGFDWRVGPLSVQGEAYFAICSHAIMAGESVTASYKSGKARASFQIGADYLICWKPYCYDINLRVHFKAGYGALKASLSADLHIWGPEFGGTAKIKVALFKFTIKFGNQSSQSPRAIGRDEFQSSFLPANHEVCSVAVAQGLTRQVKARTGDEEIWVVNPRDLVLTTDSVIPTKRATHPASSTPILARGDFGIVPMGVKASDVVSDHAVTMTYQGTQVPAAMFKITAITRQAPTGMWGTPSVVSNKNGERRLRFPGVNGARFVKDTISGLRIEPGAKPKAGQTHDLSVKVLGFEVEGIHDGYAFGALPAFRDDGAADAARRTTIQRTIVSHAARDTLLTALGFDPRKDVALSADVTDTFVFAPKVKDNHAAA